jgi:hypothetical protein
VVPTVDTPEKACEAAQPGWWHGFAAVPGIDVVITGNSDLTNFSGDGPKDPRCEQMMPDVRNGMLKAGKFFGKLTQGEPSNDGWVNPPGGGGGKKGGKKGGGGQKQ